MRFSSLIWKNLLRRPLRTGLTLVALATAIASVVALMGIARGFQDSFADVYRSHEVDIVVSRQGSADRLSSSIDQPLADRLRDVPGVSKTAPVLLETLSLEDEGVYGLPAMGIPEDSWLMDDYEIQRSPDTSGKRVLYLGVHLADRLEREPGQTVQLFEEPFQIAGVFTSQSTWENGSIILPLSELQELTGREGQVTYVNVILRKESGMDGTEDIVSSIKRVDAKLLPLATEEFVSTDTRMKIASAMAWMTSMIAILIGSIGTLNTMMTSVIERTREIGILRAIGWSSRRIAMMIMGESTLLALMAGGLGVVLAITGTWALGQAPAAKGIVDPTIDSTTILQGMGIGLVIGLLGAWLPAWRASRMQPVEAFRDS